VIAVENVGVPSPKVDTEKVSAGGKTVSVAVAVTVSVAVLVNMTVKTESVRAGPAAKVASVAADPGAPVATVVTADPNAPELRQLFCPALVTALARKVVASWMLCVALFWLKPTATVTPARADCAVWRLLRIRDCELASMVTGAVPLAGGKPASATAMFDALESAC